MSGLKANVGLARNEVVGAGSRFPMLIFYPTLQAAKSEALGPYFLEVALGASIAEGRFPLVMISHGSGGTPLVYRTLAHFLASRGFIVGLPEHPGNNVGENSRQGKIENLIHRPEELRASIDWFFDDELFSKALASKQVSVIGHSMGGYTALALAGGRPRSLPRESDNGIAIDISVGPDSRISALVLLAPATPWFQAPESLRAVTLPILLIVAEKDRVTPADFHGGIVRNGVGAPEKLQYQEVPNAGHFSFLSVFPAEMSQRHFPPLHDPEGFDRERFLAELNEEIFVFLKRNLDPVGMARLKGFN